MFVDLNVCSVNSGWGYGGSGYGYSYYSSSYSEEKLIDICNEAILPSECIKANPACQWCAQEVSTYFYLFI